jgi:hypothetical protein
MSRLAVANLPSNQWVLGFFPGVKWAGCEDSSPSSVELKNEGSYISASSMCLHGVDSDNFTYYLNLHFAHYILVYKFLFLNYLHDSFYIKF